jgi:hypothetical protein
MIRYSQWTEPVGNKHPQRRCSTNYSTGAYRTLLSHWFFGVDVVPLTPTGCVLSL